MAAAWCGCAAGRVFVSPQRVSNQRAGLRGRSVWPRLPPSCSWIAPAQIHRLLWAVGMCGGRDGWHKSDRRRSVCVCGVGIQMNAAVAAARAAFVSWRDVPVQQRMRVMLKYQVRHGAVHAPRAVCRGGGWCRSGRNLVKSPLSLTCPPGWHAGLDPHAQGRTGGADYPRAGQDASGCCW